MASAEVVDAALASALATGELVASGDFVGPADLAVRLSKRERTLLDRAAAAIIEGGMTPPTLRELAASHEAEERSLADLLGTLEDEGRLVRVSEQLWFAKDGLERYRTLCEDVLLEQGCATLSLLREAWGVTRKWAVPVAEHFDATGLTVREGDVRRLRRA